MIIFWDLESKRNIRLKLRSFLNKVAGCLHKNLLKTITQTFQGFPRNFPLIFKPLLSRTTTCQSWPLFISTKLSPKNAAASNLVINISLISSHCNPKKRFLMVDTKFSKKAVFLQKLPINMNIHLLISE